MNDKTRYQVMQDDRVIARHATLPNAGRGWLTHCRRLGPGSGYPNCWVTILNELPVVNTGADDPEWRNFETRTEALTWLRSWLDQAQDVAANEGCAPEFLLWEGGRPGSRSP